MSEVSMIATRCEDLACEIGYKHGEQERKLGAGGHDRCVGGRDMLVGLVRDLCFGAALDRSADDYGADRTPVGGKASASPLQKALRFRAAAAHRAGSATCGDLRRGWPF